MKIFTFAVVGVSLLAANVAVAETPSFSPFNIPFKGHARGLDAKAADLRKVPGKSNDFWKPKQEKYYSWNGRDWQLDDTYTKTYDFAGNVINEVDLTSEGETIVTEYTYNEHGKQTSRLSKISTDGVNFDNSARTIFQYDPILPDLITARTEWMWMNNAWQLVGNNYRRSVKRDEKGNVVFVEIAVLFNGYYDPTERLEITYGEDGKASMLHSTSLAYNYDTNEYYWVDNSTVKDIVWENTDGQITDVDKLFIGGNRVRSALRIVHELDYQMQINAQYVEGSEAYTANVVLTDGNGSVDGTVVYTPLENGGYRATTTTSYPDGNEVTNEEVAYDSWGYLTKSYADSKEGNNPLVIEEDTKGVVEYDTDGVPTAYEVSQTFYDDPESPLTEYMFRAEFSNYCDVTASVGSLPADSDTPAEYYSLQGQRLINPQKGCICIRVQNGKASKVVVR